MGWIGQFGVQYLARGPPVDDHIIVWFTTLYLFGPRSFFIHSLCENQKVRFDSLCVEPCFSGVPEGDHCSTGVGRMVLKKTTYLVVCSVIMTVKVILLLL